MAAVPAVPRRRHRRGRGVLAVARHPPAAREAAGPPATAGDLKRSGAGAPAIQARFATTHTGGSADMSDGLLKRADIEALEGLEKTHFLNERARRINKSLGDLTG